MIVPRCRPAAGLGACLVVVAVVLCVYVAGPSLPSYDARSPVMSGVRQYLSGAGQPRRLRWRMSDDSLPHFIRVEGFISAPTGGEDYVAFGRESVAEPPPEVSTTAPLGGRTRNHPAVVAPARMRFLLQPRVTCNNKTLLLIVVCSAVTRLDLRHAIRHTWGAAAATTTRRRHRSAVRLVFVVGRPEAGGAQAQSALEAESDAFGDVLQADFVDSYANLSLKTLAALRWSLERCASRLLAAPPLSSPFFVMKTDDDVFVNVPNVVRFVTDLVQDGRRRFVTGHLFRATTPDADPRSKWYTPHSAYRNRTYPPYLSGAAYVISGDALPRMYDAAARSDPFWLEDVYVTGILARLAGCALIHNDRFDYRKTNVADVCRLKELLSSHELLAQELYDLWRNMQVSQDRCAQTAAGHVRISKR